MQRTAFFSRQAPSIFLFFAALFIRLPFFFRDYIDRDESTFILMGQSIVDGHLPYDHLWDLKPPLLFYLFAMVEYFFPESFVAIRLFGVVLVFLSALILTKIARLAGLKNGFLIGLSYVILSSEFGSLQGVMSEHFAVLFLLAGLWLLLKNDRTGYVFAAGLFYGCALLCKLNYAYAVTAGGLAYFILLWKAKGMARALGLVLILCTGAVLPVVFMVLPFWLQDKMDLFMESVFLAPLEYGRASQLGFLEKFQNTWWIILAAVLLSLLALRYRKTHKRLVDLSIAMLLATVYTFFSSGIVNGHYLVQVYPFILLLVFGIFWKREVRPKPALTALVVVVLSAESLVEYYRVAQGLVTQSTPYTRPSFVALRALEKNGLEKQKIFFADYHIAYWLLHQYPLTKSTTHPSNIARPYLFPFFNDTVRTSLGELRYLMDTIRPEVVVSRYEKLGFFPAASPENQYFREVIEKEFVPVMTDPKNRVFIWKRKPGAAIPSQTLSDGYAR